MSGSSSNIARRVQANVYYTDKRGVNHSVRVKTAILGQSGGCNIEIEPDEQWKEATMHNGLVLELQKIGQELPCQEAGNRLPVAKAVAKLANDLHVRALYAEQRAAQYADAIKTLRQRFLIRLSMWLKPVKLS